MQLAHSLSRREFLAGATVAGAAGLSVVSSAVHAAERRSKEKPLKYQIGCYTRPWAAHEYTVALDAIAEAGFKYVGLMTNKGGQIHASRDTR